MHAYRLTDLHTNTAIQEQAKALGFQLLGSEICFNIELSKELAAEERPKLEYLLQETFEPEKFAGESFFKNENGGSRLLEVGPRQQFTSAWSTNAVSICAAICLDKVTRIEQSRRYLVKAADDATEASFLKLALLVHDRMTECVYPDGIQSFDVPNKPAPWTTVPVMEQGRKALEEMSAREGLGYDDQDLDYYVRVFRDELKRNPTTVECVDLAQGNSEHSRHWFFGGRIVIDGETMPCTLFELVKWPFKKHPSNSTIAFKDNSSALRGFQHKQFFPVPDGKETSTAAATGPCAYGEVERDYDITLTAETHNFPCGIAPYPGAETGQGGRIRDGQATGRGSLIVASVAAYAVGNLRIPGYEMPWESKEFAYPENMADPLKILIDASNGASDYGNKFGEPLLCGFVRSFGHRTPGTGERLEWVKPIMMSGGIGQMNHEHVDKMEPAKGYLVVKIGGPAYRIGVGGGSASSMVAGDNAAELDFNAVQRGDAEMAQKVNRVIRACVELGKENPILSIHDQGCGGSGNVLKEIAEPAGAEIDIRKFLVGDPSMSILELWVAEFQENDALLLKPEHEALFNDICERERAPYSVVGKITGDGQIVVKDSLDGSKPVDLPLEKVLGKMPQKTFEMRRTSQPARSLTLPPGLLVKGALTMGVLRLASVGSKRFLTNKVDRSVTGLIAQQQCVGPLHTPLANCAVIAQSPLGRTGGVTAIGEQPLKGLAGDRPSCRPMGPLLWAEALTNLVWVGISSLDSVKCSGNWMWPAKLEGEGPKMYDVAEALSEIMVDLGIAIDGGKDSLSMAARVPLPNGGSETVKCPGEITITAYAPVPDVTVKVTPDLKTSGDGVLLFVDLGSGSPTIAGSALAQVLGQIGAGVSPEVDAPALARAFRGTQQLIADGLLTAGHDRSDGGLIVAVLEMAFAGRRGITIKLPETETNGESLFAALFGEAPGLIYEVRRENLAAAQRVLAAEGVQALEIGATRSDSQVEIFVGSERVLDDGVAALQDIWEATSFQLERLQCAVSCVEEEEAGLRHRREPPYSLTFVPEPTADGVLVSGSRRHRVAVVRQEGSNGDREMAASFHLAGFEAWDVHMSDLLEGRVSLSQFRGVAFVGGFSFADTLDSAKGWAGSVLFSPKLSAQFRAFRDRSDSFSLGVCNGCQFLALLGWVPGTGDGDDSALPPMKQPRFVHNKSGRFESRFATVRIEKSAASRVWLKDMEGSQLGVWVNHGEGRCHFPDSAVRDLVQQKQLVPMRYVDDDGQPTQKYPLNPNGSPDGIVGLCSPDGRHLAMMPHPERLTVWPWQWPYTPQEWIEGPSRLQASPWLRLFQNARDWCDNTQGQS